ncbi:diguanylate cyclase [Marinobacterium lacunae]|uniref:Diguanylate cyclase n=1 Tax=Marinobacterium lacunae TaxID=1232683 RepID=A0A081FZ28_9GAMM|nr:GGDEF domain-containing phosphodiesterase [Marinobacterium lacunae]KEA63783.1 diguanylate cyclase [Marinobacterium lacunae]
MHEKRRKPLSLLALLSLLIAIMVTIVFIVLTMSHFQVQSEHITRHMKEDARRSLERLSNNIAPLMEAYAVDDYEKMVATEAKLQAFYAITLEDKRKGASPDGPTFTSGSILGAEGTYIDFDPQNEAQQGRLQNAYYSVEAPIISSQGKPIGKISVYMTGEAISQELQRVLIENISASLVLALTLIGILIYAVQHLFVRPLYKISNAFAQCDDDGIPLLPAPEFGYGEVATLSHTLNTMRDVTRKARDAVQFERDCLQNVIDGTNVGTWEWHVQTGKTVFNERWAEIIGYTLEELEPVSIDTWLKFTHPDDLERSGDALQRHFSGEEPYYECEARMRHRDGHWVWVLDRGKVFTWDADGKPQTMFGTHQDITERRQAEEQLVLSASVFQHAREGIFITDAKGLIIDVNQAFSRITGYSKSDSVGQNPRILKSGRQDEAFYQAMWQELIRKGYWSGEIWNRRKNGEIYPEFLTISAVSDAEGRHQNYVALFADISTLKAHEQKLEQIAHYDVLTGLPNRLLLADRLRQAIAHSNRHHHPLALLFLDLDGFKEVNDRLGHDIGDLLLIELSKQLKRTLREEDTLARLGGDEFVAILPDIADMKDCRPGIERILETSSKQLLIEGHPVQVSASIGVTFYAPNDESDADQLIRQADQAMYQAKLNGKNRYHIFDAKQDRSLRHRYEEIEQIRHGLAHNEFELHYQPQLNLRTGQIVGVEALIRWNHPTLGLLSPGRFLPAIETHELMVLLGDWTIEQALTQLSRWQAQGLSMVVSVNIAAVHLQHSTFVPHLQEALARYPELKPDQLELEILETSALDNMTQVSKIMRECQAIGVMFSLDDFGTGYSSLSYLKHLPVRTLKIDQTFVRDMLEDPDDLAILKGVLGLAEAFNLEVIAEGVESQAHGEKLLSLGCELAQGYGIARPMPADALPQWIRSSAHQYAG